MKNEYEVRGDVTVIFVAYKETVIECLIDTDDLERASSIQGRWFASKHHSGKHYIRGPYAGKKVFLHRFILQPNNKMVVDHMNLQPTDNRRENLRVITDGENKQNLKGSRSDSQSGVRGVSFDKANNKWYARVKVNGKDIFLGRFSDKNKAIQTVKEARAKYMPYSKEALL